MELSTFIQRIVQDGVVPEIMNNPLAQLGPQRRRYLGASILPERAKAQNSYREYSIKYRTVVANSGTRYSEPQKKGGAIMGSALIELGESDAAGEFTSQDYDQLRAMLAAVSESAPLRDVPIETMTVLLNWIEHTMLLPLLELNEKQRWDAIVAASVVLTGANNYTETVSYSAPSGHRPNVGGDWTSASYDPMDDIMGIVDLLADKGLTLNRIIAPNAVVSKLRRNTKMAQRMGAISIISGTVAGLSANVTQARLNQYLAEESLPPIEKYDAKYRTQVSSGNFIPTDAMVFLASTGRDETLDLGDSAPMFLKDTIGYTGIGTPANRNTPGRASVVKYEDGKGASVTGEAWQTALPVILEPEAIAVLRNI